MTLLCLVLLALQLRFGSGREASCTKQAERTEENTRIGEQARGSESPRARSLQVAGGTSSRNAIERPSKFDPSDRVNVRPRTTECERAPALPDSQSVRSAK